MKGCTVAEGKFSILGPTEHADPLALEKAPTRPVRVFVVQVFHLWRTRRVSLVVVLG